MNPVAMTRVVLVSIASLVGGCVDTTPLPYTERERPGPSPIADGGLLDGSDAAPRTPPECVECVEGANGACRPTYEQCAATEGCPELVTCLFRDGCFSLADLDSRISCGSVCFEELGIVSGLQPALEAAIPLNGCTQNECRAECIIE